MERYGKVWKGLERIGKVWKGLKRSGKVWKGLERSGKVWKGLERDHGDITSTTQRPVLHHKTQPTSTTTKIIIRLQSKLDIK